MTLHSLPLNTIERARAVRDGGIDALAALDTALAEAIDGLPVEKAEALKSIFGKVMGQIVVELVNPAIEAFPELEPDSTSWRAIAKSRAAARGNLG